MAIWVLFAGLPGTGKSTLARALAARLPAAILDKDRVRSALFPEQLTDYSPQQAQVCMHAMLLAAAYLTERRSVDYIFFDGRTFQARAHIEEVLAAARQAGATWRILHLTCADTVAEHRLVASDPAHPARNRDAALYHAIKQRFEPILHPALLVDTTAGMHDQLEAVERYLRGAGLEDLR